MTHAIVELIENAKQAGLALSHLLASTLIVWTVGPILAGAALGAMLGYVDHLFSARDPELFRDWHRDARRERLAAMQTAQVEHSRPARKRFSTRTIGKSHR